MAVPAPQKANLGVGLQFDLIRVRQLAKVV
jgi:hypothetical protein